MPAGGNPSLAFCVHGCKIRAMERTYGSVVHGYTENFPPMDGIYRVDFNVDVGNFHATHRNHFFALDIRNRYPAGEVSDWFGEQSLNEWLLSWANLPPDAPLPGFQVSPSLFFEDESPLDYEDLREGDPVPNDDDPYDYNVHTIANMKFRIAGYQAWQSALTRLFVAQMRVVSFKWRPAQVVPYSKPTVNTRYSLPGSWQRVNKIMTTDASLKAVVEANADVMHAATYMDMVLQSHAAEFGVDVLARGTVRPGNRFPVPKRWWCGSLYTRLKVEDASFNLGVPAFTRYRDLFGVAATAFRQAVAKAIVAYQLETGT